jgi:hypothetical protein
MTNELTRRELFDVVWKRPMTKVAADLGVSDVVAQDMLKHRIPVPGRGYRAKPAAGKASTGLAIGLGTHSKIPVTDIRFIRS